MNKVYQACYEIRQDAGGRKGKQCPGGYWIPANKQCGKGGGKGGAKGGKMRSPGGGMGMGAKAAIAAGGLALAGGGAALAYKNRKEIVRGVDQAGEAIRGKTKELYGKAVSGEASSTQRQVARSVKRGVNEATQGASEFARSASRGAEKVVRKTKAAVGGIVKKVTGGSVKKAKESMGQQPKKEEAPPQK